MKETDPAPVRTRPLPLEFPGAHYMDEEEVEAAARVLRAHSPFRYYGPEVQNETRALERELAQFLGVPHALAVGSGTGALHVALAALGVGPGKEVIVPAYLWAAILSAVVNRGAIPVLADIDDTFCLDPAAVERAITPRTAGIVLVHMSGAPGDAPALAALARSRGLFLLEDCAQCAGGAIHGRRVGTFGDMGIFSFQLNKNMTAGEGGAIATGDFRLYQRAMAFHDQGYARDENGRMIFNIPELCLWGMGYRMDELRAAVLRVQLRKLPRIVEAMRRSKYKIRRALEKFPSVALRRVIDADGDTGCFLITTYRDAATAKTVQAALRAEGIATAPQGNSNILMTDWGLHLYYKNLSLFHHPGLDGRHYSQGACPVADSLFERSILLPIPSCLTESDEDDIIRAFEKVLA
jgi:8-amino-3,8-dideoxy-alpha-D-manno-octulosonate transaminase